MSLTLHYHPLSSFCMKVLVGLYELGLPFERNVVDLADAAQRDALLRLSPIGKFPVLCDGASVVPESTCILEHLGLVPSDPERAAECRFRDRFFDMYIHLPMQKVVGDRLRPEGQRDPLGVADAKAQIATSYAILEAELGEDGWALGREFSMADCAAAPALHYAAKVVPFGAHRRVAAYYERLAARASFARVLDEAKPYASMFPAA